LSEGRDVDLISYVKLKEQLLLHQKQLCCTKNWSTTSTAFDALEGLIQLIDELMEDKKNTNHSYSKGAYTQEQCISQPLL
jgi:hypothetical protein